MNYNDLFIYNGNFKNDLFEGKGIMRYINGEIYEGEWKENEFIFGRKINDMYIYKGNFKNEKMNGNGIIEYGKFIKYEMYF